MNDRYERIGVYIITNRPNGTLYTGATNDLVRRIYEHRQGLGSTFSAKYNLKSLVFYEVCDTLDIAFNRERSLKAKPRKAKIELIESLNPDWDDLWFEIAQP